MKRGILIILAVVFLAVAPQVMAATGDAAVVDAQKTVAQQAIADSMNADTMDAVQGTIATDKLEKNEKGLQQMMDMMKQKGTM